MKSLMLAIAYAAMNSAAGDQAKRGPRPPLREDLAELVKDIRPGQSIADIDELREVSNGKICVETLRRDCQNWRAREKQPVFISTCHRRKIVTTVHFPAAQYCAQDVLPYGTAQVALDSVPGARIYRGIQKWGLDGDTIVQVPTQTKDLVGHLHYTRGKLCWIGFVFDDKAVAAEQETPRQANLKSHRKLRDAKKKSGQLTARRKKSTANRAALAEMMLERAKTQPVHEPDMPFSAAKFGEMVAHLRPGMGPAEIDELSSKSFGLITGANLSSKTTWNKAYDMAQPCKIGRDRKGKLTSVEFSYRSKVLSQLVPHATPDALIHANKGAMAAPGFEKDKAFRCFLVQDPGADYACLVTYFANKLHGVRFATVPILAAAEKRISGRKDACQALKSQTPETHAARLDRLGADGVLRERMNAQARTSGDPTYLEIAEWLIGKSTPDDRHYLLDMNWGHGFDLPLWIIRQPDTDVSTVLKALWLAQPISQLRSKKTAGKAYAPGPHFNGPDFVLEILKRLEDGFYQTASDREGFAFDPKMHAAHPDAALPQIAFTARPGRDLDPARLTFPQHWGDYLN